MSSHITDIELHAFANLSPCTCLKVLCPLRDSLAGHRTLLAVVMSQNGDELECTSEDAFCFNSVSTW